MEYPLSELKEFSDLNEFDFWYDDIDIMVNETATNFSKGIEDIGSASGSNGNQPVIDEPNSNQVLPAPANELHESPSTSKPSQVDVGVELPPSLSTTNEQTQPDPMNVDLDTYGEVPLDQLIASPELPDLSFINGRSSDSNLEQPIYLGFERNNPSLNNDDDAHQTTSPPLNPLTMERTNLFPLPLEEMLPKDGVYTAQPDYLERRVNAFQVNLFNTTQPVSLERKVNSVKANNLNSHIGSSLPEDGVYTAQPVYLERRDNSVEANKPNGHLESSLRDELQSHRPQRVESVNRGRRVTFADQFQQNNGNNDSNGNQQPLAYPNLTSQSVTGVGLLHGRSTQVNRQAPTWNSYRANDFYRPLAPSGSQADEFQSIGNSYSQHYNFIQPRSSSLLRSQQQLNNPSQLLNQVPNRPNASDSLLQNSMLTKHSMPSQLMSQNFSNQQHDQVPMTPGAYNPRTYSTTLTESSMPLRTSALAPSRQNNPLDVSDLRYRNSLQPRSSMLSNSSGRYNFQDLNDYRDHQTDRFNLTTTQLDSQVSNSMLQDSPMHSGSYQLPRHQQASRQFPMPCFSNSDLYNSILPETSILQRFQQQQELLNQHAGSNRTYPISGTGTGTGTSMSSIVCNSLLQNETGDTSASHQVGTPQSNHWKRGAERRPGPTPARTRYGLGESSSSFKRFRRESSTLPMPQRDPSTLPMPQRDPSTLSMPMPQRDSSILPMPRRDPSTLPMPMPRRDPSTLPMPQRDPSILPMPQRDPSTLPMPMPQRDPSTLPMPQRDPSILPMPQRDPSTLPMPMPQRDPSTLPMPMPMPTSIPVPNAERENRNLLSMHNETNTSSNASNLSGPRPIENSFYDPLFEGIGLPVDPHLRMFATMRKHGV